MKRGDGRLDLRPRSFFSDAVHSEYRSGAIADIHHPTTIECDSRRNTKIARKGHRFFERRYFINHSFEPARDEQLAIVAECNAGGVCDVAGVLRNVTTKVDSEKRDRQLFPTRS